MCQSFHRVDRKIGPISRNFYKKTWNIILMVLLFSLQDFYTGFFTYSCYNTRKSIVIYINKESFFIIHCF